MLYTCSKLIKGADSSPLPRTKSLEKTISIGSLSLYNLASFLSTLEKHGT